MSYVATPYALPSVTRPDGSVMPIAPVFSGRCSTMNKSGVRYARRGASVIRAAGPRPKVVMTTRSLGSLGINWGSLFGTALGIGKGLVAGAAGGPAGMVGGAITGGLSASKGGGNKQSAKDAAAAEQAQANAEAALAAQQGPLAKITTTELVVGGLAFTAFVLALTAGRR